MKFCTHCGTPLNDDTAFCPKCGQEVEEMPEMAAAEMKSTKSAESAPDPAPAPALKKGSIVPALVSILLYFGLYFLNIIISTVRSVVTLRTAGAYSGNMLGTLLVGQFPAFLYLLFGTGSVLAVFLIRRRSLQQNFTWSDVIPVPVFLFLSIISGVVLSSVNSIIMDSFVGSEAMTATSWASSIVGLLLSSVFNSGLMLVIYFMRKSGAKIASIIITVVLAIFAVLLGVIGMGTASALARLHNTPESIMSPTVQFICVLAPVISVEFALLLLGAFFLGGCKKAVLWGSIGCAAGSVLKLVFEIIALFVCTVSFRMGTSSCSIANLAGLFGVSTGVILPLIGMIITVVKERRTGHAKV